MTRTATDVREAPRPQSRRVALIVAVVVLLVAAAIVVFATLSVRRTGAALAQLRLRSDTVSVSATNGFTAGVEGQDLAAGDSIRTDENGQAQIDFFNGSLTRLDRNTTVALNDVTSAPTRKISLDVGSGRSWHRVTALTSSADRYEMHVPNAVATVQGTSVLADCRQTCYIASFDNLVTVRATNGETEEVDTGECVQVTPDGGLKRCNIQKAGLIGDWVKEMIALDGLTALATIRPTATPTASPGAVVEPAPRRRPRPAPVATRRPTPRPTFSFPTRKPGDTPRKFTEEPESPPPATGATGG